MEELIKRTSSDQPFFDTKHLHWAQNLEQNHQIILTELMAVLRQTKPIPGFADLSKEQEKISSVDQWKVFILMAYGREVAGNSIRCPQTMPLLRQIPGLQSAMFSIFKPGTVLTPHRGPYKGVLRYHLGLIIPDQAHLCGIRVADQVYHWRSGQGVLFDDSYEHEAWNHSGQDRVVLFLDIKRPLPWPVSMLNDLFVFLIGRSPFIQSIVDNAEAWA